MANDATPDGVLPPAPLGSDPLTETRMYGVVVVAGSGLTVLVGGVVSMSQEVDSEPVPKLPASSWMPEALTVSVYVPSAVVRPDSPSISYVEPESRPIVTALVMRKRTKESHVA